MRKQFLKLRKYSLERLALVTHRTHPAGFSAPLRVVLARKYDRSGLNLPGLPKLLILQKLPDQVIRHSATSIF
jgi:hypothetical protein